MAQVRQSYENRTTQGTEMSLPHTNFWKRLIGFLIRRESHDEMIGLEFIEESPVSTVEWDEEGRFKWVPISYRRLDNILHKSHEPTLVVFYSNMVSRSRYKVSNVQSERCEKVCKAFEDVVEHLGQRVNFVKFDIEKSDLSLQISQIPTIKLFPGLDTNRNYPVQFFDDPLTVLNYERFLKHERVRGF